MRNRLFPTLIVDDFLTNPDDVVEFSKTLEYNYSEINMENYAYTGKRSQPLHLVNNDFFVYVGNKILNCFGVKDCNWNSKAYFQIVDKKYRQGWIHKDNCVLAAIIYLNKNYNYESGTSLYEGKNVYNIDLIEKNKKSIFKNLSNENNLLMTDREKEILENHKDPFQEVLNVKNKYNRLFAFEGHMFHSANDYENDEPRIILIYFFDEINIKENAYPLLKI